jgi:uracil-DNA glycosylase
MNNLPGAKHRVSLWLRGERAFGLDSVVAPRAEEAIAPPLPEASEPVAPAPEKKAIDLFGGSMAKAAPEVNDVSLAPFTSDILSRDKKLGALKAMDEQEVKPCAKCRLCEKRTNTVFGEGDADAAIFFIGEGPGETEDLTGRPFVGRAGELLNKMIAGMGLRREQVFIANIVKCRPPGNREPATDEVATCTPYLVRQIEIVRPKVIVTLGRPSAQYMLNTKTSMGRLRGQWQSWRGIRLMPTYHPAYLLRAYTEENRRAVWSDLQQVMSEVGLKPAKQSR